MGKAAPLFPLVAPFLFVLLAHAQNTCREISFRNRTFATCNDLSALGAQLFWTYFPENGTIEIAFRAPQADSGGFVAWGLNPKGTGMVGTEALVALQNSSSSTHVWAYATYIANYRPSMEPASTLPNVNVTNLSAELTRGHMTIYAAMVLPGNRTTVNHAWQSGEVNVAGGLPSGHKLASDNLRSHGSLDFLRGLLPDNGSSAGGHLAPPPNNARGILYSVACGVLMPIGAIIILLFG